MDSDERRAEALLREMNPGPNAGVGQPGLAANVGVFRRLHWASRGATEAVRILEAHRRAGRLTAEGLETLERYREFHEAAELILVGYFQYPGDPTSTAPHGFPGRNG